VSLHLPLEVKARLIRAAADALPLEACGLVLGTRNGVTEIVPSPNLAEAPERGFLLDPAVQIAVQKRARAEGQAVLGCYHSHPSGLAEPSATDKVEAARAGIGLAGQIWLILAREPDKGGWAVRAYRLGFEPQKTGGTGLPSPRFDELDVLSAP